MMQLSRQIAIVPVLAALCLTCGCPPPSVSSFPPGTELPRVRRVFTAEEVQGPLTGSRVLDLYGAADFVYAEMADIAARTINICSYNSSDGKTIDDARLMIYVCGSGDSPDGFYHTARLLATSPLVWEDDGRPLLIVTVHWAPSRDPVADHTNLAAQEAGALRLQQMAQVHHLRHSNNPQAHVSVMAFSAGSRVAQLAYGCEIEPGKFNAVSGRHYPDEMNYIDNIIFLGSSLPRNDPLPFASIKGRFINFVNPRDTHFGDKATYVAPPGVSPSLMRLLSTRIGNHSPASGASAHGFDGIATLVTPQQFEVIDQTEAGRQAFKAVNVKVPNQLTAYGLFGVKMNKDDLDDFINAAPNHYIMVGRGPGGAIDGELFEQYRDVAEEFVRFVVAPAMLTGRVRTTVLFSKPKPLSGMDAVTHPLTMPLKAVEPVFSGLRGDSSNNQVQLLPIARWPGPESAGNNGGSEVVDVDEAEAAAGGGGADAERVNAFRP